MTRSARLVAAALLALAIAACSSDAQEPRVAASAALPATSAAHAPSQPGASRARLVFFMNPNGAPCQMQDRILRQMAGELSPRVELVYFRTTEPGDIARFEAYGIRSLPQLLVTDADGRELRRGTPGIQGPDQIRGLVGL